MRLLVASLYIILTETSKNIIMKLNVNFLSLVLVLFAGLFIVSCANEESAANVETTDSGASQSMTATGASSVSGGATSLSQAAQSSGTVQPAESSGPVTSIKFDNSTHDFGTLATGEKAQYKYEFTNTGKEPLIISNVKASCGCTAPSYSREPIAPGKRGFIDVEYSATGSGDVSKSVTITANTEPANTIIYLKAHVTRD